MRWRLLQRRLSLSAPRVIVRQYLPWPLRWALLALVLGFCAALALWAFELGRSLAGLEPGHHGQRAELEQLRATVAELQAERDSSHSLAATADSLLKAEQVTLERLTAQVRELERVNQKLRNDLAFFEQLMPAAPAGGLAVRQLDAELMAPGQLRFRLLVMQSGRGAAEFKGRYELSLSGQLEGKPWNFSMPGGPQPLQVKHYRRVEGTLEYPQQAMVKSVQVRVIDPSGTVRASQVRRL